MLRKIIFVTLAALTLALCVGCSSDKEEDTTPDSPKTVTPSESDNEDSPSELDTDGTTDSESDSESKSDMENVDSPAADASEGSMTVTFQNGTSITLGAAADDVIPTLGEPTGQFEAPSCLHPGNDVVYTYNSYTVTTQPNADGKNIVTSLEIMSDAVTLDNGVAVNGAVADAKEAFGENYTEAFGLITYEAGKIKIDIVGDDDVIVAIAFTYVGEI